MSESNTPQSSISFKKSSRSETSSTAKPADTSVKLSTKQRRMALKEFYKQAKQGASETQPVETNNYAQISANFDAFVRDSPLKQMLAVQNEITSSLNGNQSEIKSIVYNNYYDLIKLNEFLTGQDESEEPPFDMACLESLEALVDEIQGIDTAIAY
ncbi:hypothetical protein BABINDRAFT_163023 [Babjeviella inositovora NRRL Y-12698]|uniref:Vacuolar protein sorting-associated protein 51 homolog n=1 Tax=Babjeviella inositovora NRRL Y-12698 TaxID=984486 RepID=A0A1E3QLL7_9ASCO|nr:uncharacterized protein BABINDRAFT_163023 [Babjeviella inositovora NRRL Y-12698]ODQ77972.1 hypothetical protein BABINDRAFT_163023 [Babjeviella inositovora NRRL Y-12698]